MSKDRTRVRSTHPTVFIWDRRSDRADIVNRLASECGLPSRQLEDLTRLKKVQPHDSLPVVAIGIDDSLTPGHPVFDILRTLREKGARAVCYGEGVEHWPVSACCEILLAGAACLLDSSQPEFQEEFRNRLSALIIKETERANEEDHIKGLMKSLGAVGESPSIRRIFRWAERVSTLSDFPVIISGETGTGKELIASAIHRLDRKRGRGPFIVVNCSAINTNLAESELFGHRRGAFTGADRDRLGLIRAARGGVLFLDEIGEMDLNSQTKLLRAVETRRVLGVGEDQEAPVDIRVLAATNKDLHSLVAQNKFRGDLFYRLNALSIHVPPLRERPEDIPPLVEHFLRKDSTSASMKCCRAERGFLEALRYLTLPGNVRQLENIIRQSLAAKEGDGPLTVEDLPIEVLEELSKRDVRAQGTGKPGMEEEAHAFAPCAGRAEIPIGVPDDLHGAGWNLQTFLGQCEKYLLEAALKKTQGNHSKAAQLLGITPRTVYNKIRKYLS